MTDFDAPAVVDLLNPGPGRVVVYFPLVGSEADQLASLECQPWTQGGGRRFMVSHPNLAPAVEQILADARFDESPATAEQCVRVRFKPSDFAGPSFGLALALADKLARFALDHPLCRRPIYATGGVIPDGGGRIGGVDDFAAKVAVVERSSQGGGLFVYARAEEEWMDEELRGRLETLRTERGIDCHAIGHVDEWRSLLPHEKRPRLAALGVGAAAGVGLLLSAVLLWDGNGEDAGLPLTIGYYGADGPIPPNGVLRSGQRYRIELTLGEDGWLYVLQIDERSIECLFPMGYFDGRVVDNRNPVRAGRRYVLPGEGHAFVLDDRVGWEEIRVVADRRRHDGLEMLCQELSEAHAREDGGRKSALWARLRRVLEDRSLPVTESFRFRHLD